MNSLRPFASFAVAVSLLLALGACQSSTAGKATVTVPAPETDPAKPAPAAPAAPAPAAETAPAPAANPAAPADDPKKN